MAFEIERRYLIANDNWKKFITHKTAIEQGYLSQNLKDWIIRLRFNGKNFKIALKKHIKNFSNYEFEYLIPNSDGEKILSSIENTIKKERYFLKVNQKNWIVDCFKDNNYPLEIAEIELQTEKEKFNIPSFLGREVTGINIFSNFSLTTYPFSKWESKDLKNINID